MFESILHAGSFNIISVALAMATALLMGLVISICFKLTDKNGGSLPLVLAVLPLLVSAVIMLVNGNLGTSVAVLGAFGLVRFRSAAGSAKEITFIFFSMAVGLAAGLGFITLAVCLTLVVAAIFFFLSMIGLGEGQGTERQLRITIPEDLNYAGLFDDLFSQYMKRCYLERVKTTNMGTLYELCYRVTLKQNNQEKELIDALRCRNGNLSISLGMPQKEKNEL